MTATGWPREPKVQELSAILIASPGSCGPAKHAEWTSLRRGAGR